MPLDLSRIGRRWFLRLSGAAFGTASGLDAIDVGADHHIGTSPRNSLPGDDLDEILNILQHYSKQIVSRFSGSKVSLLELYGQTPEKATFLRNLADIATRINIPVPDVVIVNPPFDNRGNPKAQKPDATAAWANSVSGKRHYIILITAYLKDGLKDHDEVTADEQLLALLAHETGHFLQYKMDGRGENARGRRAESLADSFALSCPEVNPVAFKAMVTAIDRLSNEAARKHPMLYKDYTRSSVLIPASFQTRMALGGSHPMTSTRIRAAEKESKRRASLPEKSAVPLLPDGKC